MMEKTYPIKVKWFVFTAVTLCLLAVLALGVFVWKLDGIYTRLNVFKEYITETSEYESMHKNDGGGV